MEFVCASCGHRESAATRRAKCDCGGLWNLDFSPPRFDSRLIDRTEWSLFRYKSFLPLETEGWKDISLGEGMTPIIRLNEEVLLKMDYFMPTLSFKDRGAALLVAHCKAIGVDSVVQDSSGNAGNSIAAYCAKAGIGCEIFVPEGTSPAKIAMIQSHGARVNIVPGTRDHCADVCREKVEREGVYYANHVYNPFFFEGTKTYVYEVFEQLGRMPSTLFIPLGNGTLFLGAMKGLEELLAVGAIERMPQVVAVQSEGCDPIAQAWGRGERKPAAIRPSPTLAEGIAIGKPMRGEAILDLIYKHGVEVIIAPEDKILDARSALARKGIYCEHTTAATYAAYLSCRERKGSAPDCLLPMCGAGLKSDH